MVRKQFVLRSGRHLVKNAFTMIELIFAIVVIAVVLLTIPMMIQVNNKALEGNVAQEAIFLVSTVLTETTALIWDDRSIDGNVTTITASGILDTGGDGAYSRVVGSSLRQGGMQKNRTRKFFDTNTAPLQTAVESLTGIISGTSTSDLVGYKNVYSIGATRGYIADTPAGFNFTTAMLGAGVSSNIKMTTVEINATIDGVATTISRLRAYTCNVGEADPITWEVP